MRSEIFREIFRAVLVCGVLSGCGVFSSDDEAEAPFEPQVSEVVRNAEPITSVNDLEIGRSRDGFVVTAFGTAPALGFSAPRLRARRDGAPGNDGYIDFDFVANPPKPELERPGGAATAKALRADVFLNQRQLRNVLGIRVHALGGGLQLDF